MARRGSYPSRSAFADENDYARTKLESGGPRPDERWSITGSGYHSRLFAAIWGRDEAEFAAAVEAEHKAEQARRPHAFVQKFEPNRRRRSVKGRSGRRG